MAISRMQQPRQLYGLGSFVKKAVRKVTKPVTKVAKKIVPKEVAGIMRAAAPFLPPGYREAAYLLGTAKQTGRISPLDLALVAAPYANKALGKTDAGFFAETFPKTNAALFGAPEVTAATDLQAIVPGDAVAGIADTGIATQKIGTLPGFGTPRTVSEATTGLFGTGGKMFQFGGGDGIVDQFANFRDQSKLGSLLLGDGDGGFSKSKIAGLGIGTLSLIQNSKTPDEAGTALVEATGDSADYERGRELFAQLTPELFAVPQQFRMANGGLMRTNYAQGSEYIRKRPNFFKDLFLERKGGGGRDYMLPMEASERKDLNEVFIFANNDMAKAKELEAEKIFPVLQDKAMEILDVVLDMPDSEEKDKILYDINHGILNKQKDSGMAGIANARYETIQKYGYLLNDKQRGLGSMTARKAQQADGGLMRTNYAIGSDDEGEPIRPDPTKPINPFGPKPTGPVLPDKKMADLGDQFLSPEYEEEFRKFLKMLEESEKEQSLDNIMDMFKQYMLKKEPRVMEAATGGRANLALGTKPTPEESGLGGLPIEADMRYTGGFMPYGAKEKADDVPARLSKNEFVFTADAVRAAGGGSVNEGAKKMYATMKQLEKKPEAKGMMA